MKIQYTNKRFNKTSLEIIDKANEIIQEYQDEGFDLTLRQLYYQFVSRDLIPNKQSEYNRLGSIINDARLAGLIDWNVIIDRTRNIQKNSHWESPSEIIEACANQYEIDKRNTQDIYIEIWIEKDALIGVISDICSNNDIPYFSCRGYTSQSEMWSAAMRILKQEKPNNLILHLGDHDPSGLDMTRDIQERFNMFYWHHCEIESRGIIIDRIALNYDQIEKYNPPPNPAKSTDSRFDKYIREYGHQSWELDALEPSVIVELIRDSIYDNTDMKLYNIEKEKENNHKEQLMQIKDKI